MEPAETYHRKLERALEDVGTSFLIVDRGGEREIRAGSADGLDHAAGRLAAVLPRLTLNDLGDAGFREAHGTQYACMSGAMANGISSVELVQAMARGGMLGIFGSAGLPVRAVERAIDRLDQGLTPGQPRGFNLIHSPHEPAIESGVVELYLKRGVHLVEASAFLDLTLPLVRYRLAGIRRDADGSVVAPNRVIAKVSRVEVASRFLAPAPERFVRELVERGDLDARQAELARELPLADDLTAEADSGGHTDNQPAIVLLPTMVALRDRLASQHGYRRLPRVGAAGGISTPWSAAAALAMGASYLVTGSINQACLESGTSPEVRKMLAQAQQGDIAMAPAADMFEMGVKVQVLKRGTMFAMRAAKLFELYRAYPSLEELPQVDRTNLEKTIFRAPLPQIWDQTRAFFADRDPTQIDRAERDPKHRMALVFRWYLGQSSHWANVGEPGRTVDYQVWCGPAMAAFNEWVRGSSLEAPENRRAVSVSLNILYGAAVLGRARLLAAQGIGLPPGLPRLRPLEPADIEKRSGTA